MLGSAKVNEAETTEGIGRLLKRLYNTQECVLSTVLQMEQYLLQQ